MSLLETKVIQVENDQDVITNTSNLMGSFGWTVLSVQVTHSQNSKDLGDRVQTTTLNYATMTLQRDKHMDNYAEIVRLEEEHTQYENQIAQYSQRIANEEKKGNRILIIIFVVALIGGPILSLILSAVNNAVYSLVGPKVYSVLEWLLLGVLLVILGYSILRVILDGVSHLARNTFNKPLPALDEFLAKAPKSVWTYLYGKRAAKNNETKNPSLQDEAKAFKEEAAQRMAEIRQQAESLLR